MKATTSTNTRNGDSGRHDRASLPVTMASSIAKNGEQDRRRRSPPLAMVDGLRDYPGSKGGAGVWQTIINQIPPHEVWIEAFAGSGQVTRRLRPTRSRIAVDCDAAVVSAWRGFPGVTAICADAVKWLARYPWQGGEVVYCDPPYLRCVRSCPRDYYRHEFATEAEHARLVAVLRKIPARVILSGYPSALYSRLLADWRVVTFQAVNRRGRKVTECLWCNFPEPFALHDYRCLGRNFRERERIKRKKTRWRSRLLAMPAIERAAILETVRDLIAENGDAGSARQKQRCELTLSNL